MRSCLTIGILLVTTCSLVSASDEISKPTALIIAKERYDEAIKKAGEAHEESVHLARQRYLADLEDAMKSETKAGNLDSAILIRDEIRLIESQDKETERDLIEELGGTKWVNTNGALFEWTDDGKMLHKGNERTCVAVDKDRVAIIFSNTHIDILVFDQRLRAFEQWVSIDSRDGPHFTGKRAR